MIPLAQLRRKRFSLLGGVVITPPIVVVLPSDPEGIAGYDDTILGRTVGDYYVDPAGDDSNPGTEALPFATPMAARAAMVSGDVTLLKTGTYREKLIHDVTNGVFERYGDNKPRITASELLTGFTQCTSADSAVLGATLGVNGSPVYKTNLLKSAIDHTGYFRALNLYANGIRMGLVTDRDDNTNPREVTSVDTYHLADLFTGDAGGAGIITTVTDPDVITTAKYGDGSGLVGAWVAFKSYPNVVTFDKIVSADPANGTFDVEAADINSRIQGTYSGGLLQTPSTSDYLYSIENSSGAQLQANQYFVVENASDLDIYVYPTNPLDLSSCEYSKRQIVVEMNADGVELRGVRVDQPSGTSITSAQGVCIYKNENPAAFTTAPIVDNCIIAGAQNGDTKSPSTANGVNINNVDDAKVTGCTVTDINGVGITLTGDGARNNLRPMIDRCLFSGLSYDAWSCFFVDTLAVARCYLEVVASDPHASAGKVYGTSGALNNRKILYHAIRWGEKVNGKFQFQRTSEATFCFMYGQDYDTPNTNGESKIHDGNDSLTNEAPVADTTFQYFNNEIRQAVPDINSGFMAKVASTLGGNGATVDYFNNVLGAVNDPQDFSGETAVGEFSHNVITKLTSSQTSTLFTNQDATNIVSSVAAVWSDLDTGDLAVDSPTLSTPGIDASARMTALKAIYTQLDPTALDEDAFGNTIDWSELPMGAISNRDWVRVPVSNPNLYPDPGFDSTSNVVLSSWGISGSKLRCLDTTPANKTTRRFYSAGASVEVGKTYDISVDVESVALGGNFQLRAFATVGGSFSRVVDLLDVTLSSPTTLTATYAPIGSEDGLVLGFRNITTLEAVFDNASVSEQ